MASEEPRRTVRAADVAAAADVSPATVSLVVNDKADGRIAPATQQRVREVIEELGYRVDRSASGLAGGRAGVISLVVPDLDSPFFAHLTMGVHETLGPDTDLGLVLSGHHPARLSRSIDRVLSSRIDGLLLDAVGVGLLQDRALEPPFPVVVMDAAREAGGFASVDFELEVGAAALAEHLGGLGHRRVAYLAPTIDVASFRVREQALAAGLQDATDASSTADVFSHRLESDTTSDAAGAAVAAAWPTLRDSATTALVCATDVQAYGALRSLHELGVGIPDQVSLASFDDLPMAQVVTPSLTAVALSARQLAGVATTALLDLVDNPDAPVHRRLVPTNLMVRESTGPAPG